MSAHSSAPRLRAVPPPEAAPRAPRRRRTAEELSVIEQIRTALLTRRHRLAAVVGLVLGGFVPAATFCIAHRAATLLSLPAALALGGLAFSAPTVFGWARAALGSSLKAGGFVLLVEGCMCTAASLGLAWLGYAALALLVGINATATASRLALGKVTP